MFRPQDQPRGANPAGSTRWGGSPISAKTLLHGSVGVSPNTVSLENFNCRLADFFCGPYLGSPDRELGTRLALDRAGIAFAPATSSSGLAKMIAHFPEDDLPFFRGKMTGRGLLGWIL